MRQWNFDSDCIPTIFQIVNSDNLEEMVIQYKETSGCGSSIFINLSSILGVLIVRQALHLSGGLTSGLFCSPWNTWQCLLESSGQRAGLLLNNLQCTGQPQQQGLSAQKFQ